MKRQSVLIKGYDCRIICSDPRHRDTFGKPYERPGQNHGQATDVWRYIALGKEAAIVLTVFANEASSIAARNKPPEGAHLSFHYPWRESDEDVRNNAEGNKCDVIPAGRCFGGSGYCYAETFFKEHGSPQFEQPERFWNAFEKYAEESIAESRASAAEFKVKPCPHCKATGVIPK